MKSIAVLISVLATSMTWHGWAAAQTAEPSMSSSDSVYDTSDQRNYEASSSKSPKGDLASFIAYDVGVPLGSVRDFAANVSPVGVEFQFRGWVADRLSLGLSAEWSSFVDERSRNTYTLDNAAITASVYNRMQMTNGHFLVHYYLGQGSVRPYIGPHVGVGWTWFETQVADLELSDTQFLLNFGGEIGAVFAGEFNMLANLRYTSFPAADFLNVSNVQTVSMQVGIGL